MRQQRNLTDYAIVLSDTDTVHNRRRDAGGKDLVEYKNVPVYEGLH